MNAKQTLDLLFENALRPVWIMDVTGESYGVHSYGNDDDEAPAGNPMEHPTVRTSTALGEDGEAALRGKPVLLHVSDASAYYHSRYLQVEVYAMLGEADLQDSVLARLAQDGTVPKPSTACRSGAWSPGKDVTIPFEGVAATVKAVRGFASVEDTDDDRMYDDLAAGLAPGDRKGENWWLGKVKKAQAGYTPRTVDGD